jgi:molybdopterin-guanine dinucleotide biosynthesis adapter protein
MNVIGFCGYSGSGKTTLVEQLIVRLRFAGQRVSVIKHAHHDFDIDHEGKDSWRHRQAGAFEVVIASNRRLAKIREFAQVEESTVDQLIAELVDCDWALVEGFKHAPLPKIEVWRAATGKRAQYPSDPFVIAIATDSAAALPQATGLPVFALDDVDAIAAFILEQSRRCHYRDSDEDAGHGDAAEEPASPLTLDPAERV